MEDLNVGKLLIPVETDNDPAFGARARAERRRLAEEAGVETGGAFKRAYTKAFGGREGADTAKDFLRGVKRTFDRETGDAKEAFARKLTDRDAYEDAGREAAKRFDAALLKEIERRAKNNTLDDDTFIALTRELKLAGTKGGREFSEGAKGGVGDLADWMQGLFATAFVGAILGGVGMIVRGLQQIKRGVTETLSVAGQVERIKESFDAMARSADLSGSKILASMRTASRGMIADVDLMKQANRALQAEIPVSAESMGEMVYLSRRLAEATGRDATDALDRLVRASGKLEIELVDELGLLGGVNQALKDYEEQTGRSVKTLDQATKVQVYFNALMDEARRKVNAMGKDTLDSRDRLAQMAAAWDNLRNKAAAAVAESPKIVSFLTSMGTNAEESAKKIDQLAIKIGALVDTLAELTETPLANAIGTVTRGTLKAIGLAGRGVTAGLGMDDALGEFDFGERMGFHERRRERRAEIQNEGNSAALLLRKLRTQSEISRLREEDAEVHAEEIEMLREEITLIEDRRAALKAGDTGSGEGGGGGGTGTATQEQIDAARERLRALAEEWEAFEAMRRMGVDRGAGLPTDMEGRLQRVLELQREIRQIQQDIATAGTDAGAGAALVAKQAELEAARAGVEDLAAEWEKLPEVQGRIANLTTEITGMMVQMGDGALLSLAGGMDRLADAAAEVRDAEREMTAARIEGGEREVQAEKNLEEARDRSKQAARRALAVVEEAARDGQISQKRLNELIQQMVDILHQAGIEQKDLTDETNRSWSDTLDTFATVARGVLSLADAFGTVDDQMRSVLTSVIELTEGVAKLIASGGKDITAWFQAGSAAINIAVEAFAGDVDLAQHAASLNALKDSIDKLNETILHDMSTREIEEDRAAVGAAVEEYSSGLDAEHRGSRYGYKRRRSFAYLAQNLGLVEGDAGKEESIAALEAWAADLDEKYGTNLAEFVRNSDSEGFYQALQDLEEQLGTEVGELGTFGDDVAGTIERITWEFEALGNTDTVERLRAITQALKDAGHSAGDFQDELDELAQLDLSTAEGRTRRDEIIASMVQQMTAGGADFGDMSPAELRKMVEDWSDATAGGGVTGGGQNQARMNVNITETQANQHTALFSTMVYRLTSIDRNIATLAGVPIPSMPVVSPPSPASMGVAPQGGSTTTLTFTLAEGAVQIRAPEGGPADVEGWRQAGREIVEGMRDGAQGLAAEYRAHGLSGPQILTRQNTRGLR